MAPLADSTYAKELAAFIRKDFDHTFSQPSFTPPQSELWKAVRSHGTDLWLDTGDIQEAEKLWNANFTSLTTNNTLLNMEIQKGIYDSLIPQAAEKIKQLDPQISQSDLILEIAFVLNAYHGLELVKKFDAYVSVELHTDLAYSIDEMVEYGKRYYEICPERFRVKIPMTPEGLVGTRRIVDAGIPVNFTLGFGARQGYIASRLAHPTWVNVFMGRLNAFVSDHKLGSGDGVGEKATLATQRALVELRKTSKGPSKLIGASMRSGEQVATLCGLDVYTMPTKVAQQYSSSPSAELSNRVEDDPAIETADFSQWNADTLWKVDEAVVKACDELDGMNVASLTGAQITEVFAKHGASDVFYSWSESELKTIAADGKIPVYETWKKALQEGTVGLDALMSISALHSFIADQAALDKRIAENLG